MLLHRRHQRLDNENIRLTAISPELHAHAIVAESIDRRRAEPQFEAPADFFRQFHVSVTAEDDDCSQEFLPRKSGEYLLNLLLELLPATRGSPQRCSASPPMKQNFQP